MVRLTRLELVRVSPHAPQTCAYADSATTACSVCNYRGCGRGLSRAAPLGFVCDRMTMMSEKSYLVRPGWRSKAATVIKRFWQALCAMRRFNARSPDHFQREPDRTSCGAAVLRKKGERWETLMIGSRHGHWSFPRDIRRPGKRRKKPPGAKSLKKQGFRCASCPDSGRCFPPLSQTASVRSSAL